MSPAGLKAVSVSVSVSSSASPPCPSRLSRPGEKGWKPEISSKLPGDVISKVCSQIPEGNPQVTCVVEAVIRYNRDMLEHGLFVATPHSVLAFCKWLGSYSMLSLYHVLHIKSFIVSKPGDGFQISGKRSNLVVIIPLHLQVRQAMYRHFFSHIHDAHRNRGNRVPTLTVYDEKRGFLLVKKIAGCQGNENNISLKMNFIRFETGVSNVLSAFLENKSRKWEFLSFDLCGLKIGSLKLLISVAARLPRLKKLSLSHNFSSKMRDIGSNIAKLLKSSTLGTLILRGVQFSTRKLKHEALPVIEALRFNSTLKRLDLTNNAIGAAGVELLSQALSINTTLQWLQCDGTRLGDLGAEVGKGVKDWLGDHHLGFKPKRASLAAAWTLSGPVESVSVGGRTLNFQALAPLGADHRAVTGIRPDSRSRQPLQVL
jgi:hypothetical protein